MVLLEAGPSSSTAPAAADTGVAPRSTDEIIAFLLQTAPNTPRAPPPEDNPASLAAVALSTALVLASGQENRPTTQGSNSPRSLRMARGHAGKPSKKPPPKDSPSPRLPKLRVPPTSPPRVKATTVDIVSFRQQTSDRTVRHISPRFENFKDVDIPALYRRSRVGMPHEVDGAAIHGFYAESIRSPRHVSPRVRNH